MGIEDDALKFCLPKAKKYRDQHGVDETIDFLNRCKEKYIRSHTNRKIYYE